MRQDRERHLGTILFSECEESPGGRLQPQRPPLADAFDLSHYPELFRTVGWWRAEEVRIFGDNFESR
jgi:hypothetical protein